MAAWLLKTEPADFSWEDLYREKEAVWDGVKAPAALKNMRQMKPGDRVLIYHTGHERRMVGIAEITTYPYAIPPNNEWVFKILAKETLPQAVTLAQIKASGMFADWDLVRLPRLSVVPVSDAQWDLIMKWATE
ncbi:MAG: EVE domain-containing protein [Syntrophomonadaceae bacterium]|nr:EVE domain-containing protein [Syntrophomonadaceae bacterium]